MITHATMWSPENVGFTVSHTRELVPSAGVRRGEQVSPLPRELVDLDALPIDDGGVTIPLGEALRRSDTDGFMVVHRGTVVYERYLTIQPETSHILQSVSKSMTAALDGCRRRRGAHDPADFVTDHLPELAGSCWDGCTIEHLLDMRAGVASDESDYEDTASESYRGFRVLGWFPRLEDDPSPAEYIAAMSSQGAHGGPFEYRSILTDVLGWCLERATGEPLASLFSSRIWQPMGAGHDADLLLGPGGFPLADGGLCVTLGDLARFGLMFLQGGAIDGRQVVPRSGWGVCGSPTPTGSRPFGRRPTRLTSRRPPSTATSGGSTTPRRGSTRATASTGNRCSSTIPRNAWWRDSRAGRARGTTTPARLGDAAAFAVCAALGSSLSLRQL